MIKVLARFKGANGSAGYANGAIYTLHLKLNPPEAGQRNTSALSIHEHGKPESYVIYSGLRTFLYNWDVIL